jgi:tetratricopeptide (TPR) repeat protein
MQQENSTGVPDESVDPDRLFKEALYYLQRREPNMAAHVLGRLLELRPGEPRSLSYLGLCRAMDDKHSSEALALCEEALKAGCHDAFLYHNLGKVHLLRGSRRRAYAAFIAGLKVNPRNRGIVQELRVMGIRQTAFFPSLPRGHVVNRLAGRMRKLLRRTAP